MEYYSFEDSGDSVAGYADINMWFRGKKPEDHTPEECFALSKLLASCLNKLPENKILSGDIVYRGASLTKSDLDSIYKKGEIITEPIFLSATLKLEVADDFSYGTLDNERVIFKIKSKTGRNITGYISEGLSSDYHGETEAIFLPGTKFRIINKKVKNYRTIIEMQEI